MNYHKKIFQTASDIIGAIAREKQGAYWSAYLRLYGDVAHDLLARKSCQTRDRSELKDFLVYGLSHKGHFGQLAQDLFVLWMLAEKRGGYFVEIGAGDGQTLSNTVLLEREYGWTGLLVEPNPTSFSKISSIRAAHLDQRCVYPTSGATVEFECAEIPELSRVSSSPSDIRDLDGSRVITRALQIPTTSIAELLAEHSVPARFDYLSLDIEGLEPAVMATFPFDAFRPAIVTVEHNYGAAEARLDELMTANGYARMFREFSRFDAWYVHGSLVDRS